MKILPYQDPQRTAEERARDLAGRMSLEEKVQQLCCVYAFGGRIDEAELEQGIGHVALSSGRLSPAENIELVNGVQRFLKEKTRLGIPALIHAESLHGLALWGATSYPVPLALAASGDLEKIEEMAREIHEAMHAAGVGMALAPVLDVARDPRWGRMAETYGEAPALVAAFGEAYVRGIQGEAPRARAAAAKHFLAYAMGEAGLNMSHLHFGERELREVYAQPFERAVLRAGLASVMNAYSAIDGEAILASPHYFGDYLRGRLGFRGLTVSDYASIQMLSGLYHIAGDEAEAAARALHAGLDAEFPAKVCFSRLFLERLKRGEVPADEVDLALSRILELKFRLGLFENPYASPTAAQGLQSEKSRRTARKLARESFVLLKNEGEMLPLRRASLLPLRKEKERLHLALIGPQARSLRMLFGGYSYPSFYEGLKFCLEQRDANMRQEGMALSAEEKAALRSDYSGKELPDCEAMIRQAYTGIMNLAEAMERALKERERDFGVPCVLSVAEGCAHDTPSREGFAEALRLAEEADAVLFACGGVNGSSPSCTLGENLDRADLGLPGVQEELGLLLAEKAPLILLHFDGRPLSSAALIEASAAVLELWHPGQEGAAALTDVLFGEVSPSGRLPVTALRSSGQIPLYAEAHRGSSAFGRGRGEDEGARPYADGSSRPLFPLGYGKSYSRFSLEHFGAETTSVRAGERILLRCRFRNTDARRATIRALLFFSDVRAPLARPQQEVLCQLRADLNPGEAQEFCFDIPPAALSYWRRREEDFYLDRGEAEFWLFTGEENSPRLRVCIEEDLRFERGRAACPAVCRSCSVSSREFIGLRTGEDDPSRRGCPDRRAKETPQEDGAASVREEADDARTETEE